MGCVRFSGEPDDAWEYIIGNLPKIADDKRRGMMNDFLAAHKPQMCAATAAARHHHAGIGGLVNHTAEVLAYALQVFDRQGHKLSGLTTDSVYIAAVLHDFSKIHRYRLVNPNSNVFEYYTGWDFEDDLWTVAEANKFGLQLTYEEMGGIIQAHGGWSSMRKHMSKLGVLIHLADMESSQFEIKESGEDV